MNAYPGKENNSNKREYKSKLKPIKSLCFIKLKIERIKTVNMGFSWENVLVNFFTGEIF